MFLYNNIYKELLSQNSMKGLGKMLSVGAFALLTSVASPKRTQAGDWKVSIDNTLASKYVSNGILKGNHVVTRPSLKFKNEFDNGFLSFSTVANLDFHEEEVNKLYLGVNYSFFPSDDVSVETGYIRKMSKKGDAWKDLDVLLGKTTFNLPYTPSVEFEFNVNEGSYFGLSAEKPIYVIDSKGYGRTVTAGAELGYNIHAFRDDAGFSHLETYVKVPLTMPRRGVLSKFNGDVKVRYSAPLADDIRENWIVEFNLSKGF